MNPNRITYVDNLRIFLISLVVLHHLSITYGAPGGWYYNEGQAGPIVSIFLSMFVASNQSFFMGLLFFISAYFTNQSFKNKNIQSFLSKRILRLGIPLLLFFFVLSPLTNYIMIHFIYNPDISFLDYFKSQKGFGFGPLWFVEVLLLFTFLFTLYRKIIQSTPEQSKQIESMPGNFKIILFAFGLGIVSFLVRIWLPVGWSLEPLNFQLAFFPQYIAFLFLGVMAHQNQWLDTLNFKNCLKWFGFAQIMIFIFFPILFYIGGAASGDLSPFMGGWHYQSFLYSLWEQFTGISLMIGILGIFKYKLNQQGKLGGLMSKSAYAVYIIHPVVLVLIALNLKSIELPLLLKFIILAIPAVASCFVLAFLIRKLPVVNKIL